MQRATAHESEPRRWTHLVQPEISLASQGDPVETVSNLNSPKGKTKMFSLEERRSGVLLSTWRKPSPGFWSSRATPGTHRYIVPQVRQHTSINLQKRHHIHILPQSEKRCEKRCWLKSEHSKHHFASVRPLCLIARQDIVGAQNTRYTVHSPSPWKRNNTFCLQPMSWSQLQKTGEGTYPGCVLYRLCHSMGLGSVFVWPLLMVTMDGMSTQQFGYAEPGLSGQIALHW